jgi:hypothetical protein
MKVSIYRIADTPATTIMVKKKNFAAPAAMDAGFSCRIVA